MMISKRILILIATLCCFKITQSFKIGLGRADVTGPSVEVPFVSKKTKIFKCKNCKK